jgi:hypothetical protein
MELLFLHGLPGVGRLTVGREVEKLTGFPLFHNHLTVDLAATLFEFGSPEFVSLREHIWLEAFRRSADAALAGLVFTFAAERTVPPDFVERVVAIMEATGGDLTFVELTCSDEELQRRVSAPERRQFGKLDSPDLLATLRADGSIFRLVAPAAARRVVVDTTSRSPAAAAAEILKQIHG